jgi:AcrR family transcriptional regulator
VPPASTPAAGAVRHPPGTKPGPAERLWGANAHAGADGIDTAILDAAAECVLAFGVRRTSLSDVARRAGVSRPTVYRRWPDLTALVADVMTRQWAAVFAAAEPDRADFATAREFAVCAMVAVVRALRDHPLLVKIIDVDPELLQPYIFDRLGTGQRRALEFLTVQVADGQADGSVRSGDPAMLALTVLLAAQSFVFSGRVAASGPGGADAADAELAVLVDCYLRGPGS